MNTKKQRTESKVKEIRRHTRKKYSAEEKISCTSDETARDLDYKSGLEHGFCL
jgi:hypothetical protein